MFIKKMEKNYDGKYDKKCYEGSYGLYKEGIYKQRVGNGFGQGENCKQKSGKKSQGFTFVETMAVLAIGAILSAGCLFSASKLISMAKRNAAESQIQQFSSALQLYFLDCGTFPTSEQGLAALWEKPVLYPVPEKWSGPYVNKKPAPDPWGTNFKYINAESSLLPSDVPKNIPFILLSYGADKNEGGEGEASDIYSWK